MSQPSGDHQPIFWIIGSPLINNESISPSLLQSMKKNKGSFLLSPQTTPQKCFTFWRTVSWSLGSTIPPCRKTIAAAQRNAKKKPIFNHKKNQWSINPLLQRLNRWHTDFIHLQAILLYLLSDFSTSEKGLCLFSISSIYLMGKYNNNLSCLNSGDDTWDRDIWCLMTYPR